MEKSRYNKVSDYYKSIYGERTLKICIDGGFTCPNRDGSKGVGGCIFCSEKGSGEQLHRISIEEQIKNYLNSYKSQRANKFIVYLQNFSGTYGSIEELKQKYLACLIDERIVGVDIATRPDCINSEIVNLLRFLSTKTDVYVELGLQTANDNTGKIINRCYNTADFVNAVNLLNNANIKVIAHIMVGLPSETITDTLNSVQLLNTLPIHGVKIHSTYVLKNTALEDLYIKNKYTPLSIEEYTHTCGEVLKILNPNIIVYRITGDAPKNLLLAPCWSAHKKIVLNFLNNYLEKNDIYQGQLYKSK